MTDYIAFGSKRIEGWPVAVIVFGFVAIIFGAGFMLGLLA